MPGATLLLLAAVFAGALLLLRTHERPKTRTAAVVVLGDVARSPRMCFHVVSLLRRGWRVVLIGYFDTPLPEILRVRDVKQVRLWGPPSVLARLPRALFVLVALAKVPMQALSLGWTLLSSSPAPALVLVQTPPAIPTLGVVRAACAYKRSVLVVDWHNLGYTLLALRLGAKSALVALAESCERLLGASADVHLFVTRALRDYVVARWAPRGATAVLHDRPPQHFQRTSEVEAADLFRRIGASIWGENPFAAAERPALVISATSWTPDEDMGLLLDAAELYEARAGAIASLPRVELVVTGKGPLRAAFEATARERTAHWQHVRVRTAWVSAEDYPLLLGSAAAGVSLHRSSSGLDLPMKVVDMLGCAVPVCALRFPCLGELIEPGVNGEVFDDAPGLAAALERVLGGPSRARAGFLGEEPRTWNANWGAVVEPCLPQWLSTL